MSDLRLSLAVGPYDRMEPLKTGEVKPEGIDIDYHEFISPREIFDRMAENREFDAAEFSTSEQIVFTGKGNSPFVAIPVFPSKMFRHGFVCINRKAGIETPKDLEGKRIGIPLYTQTACVWVRGMLQDEYGVDLSTVTWVQGAFEKAGSHGTPKTPNLTKPIDIEYNTSDKSISELLADGEIDATLGSRLPTTLGHHDDVARLFPDFGQVEADYYTRTGIHPIMHLVAIKKEIHEANPWVAGSLYDAFVKAKDIAWERIQTSGAQKVMLPWLFAHIDQTLAVMGNDPWAYGLERNRKTLETYMRYMVEQHLVESTPTVDDLFVPGIG